MIAAAPTTKLSEQNMPQSNFKSCAGSDLNAARQPRSVTTASDGKLELLCLFSTSTEVIRLMARALEGLVIRTSRKTPAEIVPPKATQTGDFICAGTAAIIAVLHI